MKFCPKCGNELKNEQSKFCPKCGNQITIYDNNKVPCEDINEKSKKSKWKQVLMILLFLYLIARILYSFS